MKYSIEIIETLSRVVTVDTTDLDEAISMVVQLHRNGEVVLSADDFVDVDFRAVEDEEHSDEKENRQLL